VVPGPTPSEPCAWGSGLRRHDGISQASEAVLPFHELRQRLKIHAFENGLPAIHPIVSQQSLCDVSTAARFLPLRLQIKLVNDLIDLRRIIRQMNQSIRPIKKFPENIILRALPKKDSPSGGSLKISIANLKLTASYIGPINQPGIDNKISTPFCEICRNGPM